MKLFNKRDFEAGIEACTKDGRKVNIVDLDYNGCILYICHLDPEEHSGRTKQAIVWNPKDEYSYEALYVKPKTMYTLVFLQADGLEYATCLFDTRQKALDHLQSTNYIDNYIGIAKVELL